MTDAMAKACLVEGKVDGIKFRSKESKIMAAQLMFSERQANAILATSYWKSTLALMICFNPIVSGFPSAMANIFTPNVSSIPTGGIVINQDELLNIYETGTGKIRIRGKVEVEKAKGGTLGSFSVSSKLGIKSTTSLSRSARNASCVIFSSRASV